MKIFDRTTQALEKTLDMRQEKTAIISSNIANAETPGYQAKAFDFEQSLSRALTLDNAPMDRTDPGHMTAGGEVNNVVAEVYADPNNEVREDGNTVNREKEMMSLAENQILFNTTADLVKKKLALLRYSIDSGGSN
jgi:flagellar basal-body rod protein FlgB